MEFSLFQQPVAVSLAGSAPAYSGTDIFQGCYRGHVGAQLQVRRIQHATDLIQVAVFKGKPGTTTQLHTLHPEPTPTEIIQQTVKVAA